LNPPSTPRSATPTGWPRSARRRREEVELATLSYLDWFNQRRLHGEIGDIPPAELEATYYRQPEADTAA
jgi:putative transposase